MLHTDFQLFNFTDSHYVSCGWEVKDPGTVDVWGDPELPLYIPIDDVISYPQFEIKYFSEHLVSKSALYALLLGTSKCLVENKNSRLQCYKNYKLNGTHSYISFIFFIFCVHIGSKILVAFLHQYHKDLAFVRHCTESKLFV